jgi:hypothetical protein
MHYQHQPQQEEEQQQQQQQPEAIWDCPQVEVIVVHEVTYLRLPR